MDSDADFRALEFTGRHLSRGYIFICRFALNYIVCEWGNVRCFLNIYRFTHSSRFYILQQFPKKITGAGSADGKAWHDRCVLAHNNRYRRLRLWMLCLLSDQLYQGTQTTHIQQKSQLGFGIFGLSMVGYFSVFGKGSGLQIAWTHDHNIGILSSTRCC